MALICVVLSAGEEDSISQVTVLSNPQNNILDLVKAMQKDLSLARRFWLRVVPTVKEENVVSVDELWVQEVHNDLQQTPTYRVKFMLTMWYDGYEPFQGEDQCFIFQPEITPL